MSLLNILGLERNKKSSQLNNSTSLFRYGKSRNDVNKTLRKIGLNKELRENFLNIRGDKQLKNWQHFKNIAKKANLGQVNIKKMRNYFTKELNKNKPKKVMEYLKQKDIPNLGYYRDKDNMTEKNSESERQTFLEHNRDSVIPK